jgi:hypothetical protein
MSANLPVIGWDNIVFKSTTTVAGSTNESNAFNVRNLKTPLTTEFWRAGTDSSARVRLEVEQTETVDYMAIAGHNLSGQRVRVQYQQPGGNFVTVFDQTLTSNNAQIFRFNPVVLEPLIVYTSGTSGPPTITPAVIRLFINTDETYLNFPPARIAVMYCGRALQMPQPIYGGITPVTMARKTDLIRNMTEGGQFSGNAIISRGLATSVEFQHLRPDFVRTSIEPFAKAARTRPFFFAWRQGQYPNECALCWSQSDINPDNMGIAALMKFSMDVVGYDDVS